MTTDTTHTGLRARIEALTIQYIGWPQRQFVSRDAVLALLDPSPAPQETAGEAVAVGHLANLLRFICPDPRNLRGLKDDDSLGMEVHLRVGDVLAAHRSVAASFGSDGKEEARWIEHEANACLHCGGSGHKDDIKVPSREERRAILTEMAQLDQEAGLLDTPPAPQETAPQMVGTYTPITVGSGTKLPTPTAATTDICPKCIGTGTAGHPDSGYTCDCDGGMVDASTDNAALVEAAQDLAAAIRHEIDRSRRHLAVSTLSALHKWEALATRPTEATSRERMEALEVAGHGVLDCFFGLDRNYLLPDLAESLDALHAALTLKTIDEGAK